MGDIIENNNQLKAEQTGAFIKAFDNYKNSSEGLKAQGYIPTIRMKSLPTGAGGMQSFAETVWVDQDGNEVAKTGPTSEQQQQDYIATHPTKDASETFGNRALFYILTGGAGAANGGFNFLLGDAGRRAVGGIALGTAAENFGQLAYGGDYMGDAFNFIGGDNISNPYVREGARFGWSLLNPAYAIGGAGVRPFTNNWINASNNIRTWTSKNIGYKDGLGVQLGKSYFRVNPNALGVGPVVEKITPFTEEEAAQFIANRPMYFEVDPSYRERLRPIDRNSRIVQKMSERGPRGTTIVGEYSNPRMNHYFDLQEIFNQQHGYGLDLSKYPQNYFGYEGDKIFEMPSVTANNKTLPLVMRGVGGNDVMYANAHNMWNDFSPEIKNKLEPIFSKILKRNPPKGYSAGSRAFAIVKDIQTSIQNRFLTDNRFSIKNYDEWLEYLDDVVSDDMLRNAIKKVHTGHWYDNGYIDTSDRTVNALREALKYNYGGKIERQ